MERIEDLLLERARPRGPAKRFPLLFVHGMWERPLKEILSWIDRAIAEEPRP